MKNILTKILFPIAAVLLFAACKKEATPTYLDVISFPSGFSKSASSITITVENLTKNVETLSWPAVKYKVDAPVTYSLQFIKFNSDIDTIGAGAWSTAFSYVVGNDVLAKTFTGTELNSLALSKLNLLPDTNTRVAVRVSAYLDRPVYSLPFVISITPIKVASFLWLPGDYQGWKPSDALKISILLGDEVKPKTFDGYLYLPAGGTFQFKMTPQADWAPTVYGDQTGTSGDIIEPTGPTGNMNAGSDGYFEISANLDTKKWQAVKTVWGLIGDATPGGWTDDTPLTYDPASKTWKATVDLKAGIFKFRANKAWKIDFGLGADGKLAYANNSFVNKAYVDRPAIPVAATGTYDVVLNLSNSPNYTYTLTKK